MARARKVEIRNFRAIRSLDWFPAHGVNCLIGPGDSGKSTVLDAVDLCLGARRTLSFCDDDFHLLDSSQPIRITVTLGELGANLRSLDRYGLFLRGFDPKTGAIEPEPSRDLETVLTLEMSVGTDLEPQWRLVSERAEAQGMARGLRATARRRVAATRRWRGFDEANLGCVATARHSARNNSEQAS